MVITIGGEYGSGAKDIAQLAAEKFGYKLCDDKYMAQAVKEAGIISDEAAYKHYDESEGTASLGELQRASSVSKRGYHYATITLKDDTLPLDKRIAQTQRAVLNKLAEEDNCIILGRCADYYLQDKENVIRVWAFNKMVKRIGIISEFFGISEKEAKKLITQTDKRRAEYYNYFTGRKWNDFTNYDVLLNIDTLGVERCVELLSDFAKLGK